MIVSMIAAMDRNRLIGANNGLPWRLPADMRRFKAITKGHPVIMGRKTHESIGKPLPGRDNIVLSRNNGYESPGCTVVHTVGEALARCAPAHEAMIIGGATVYEQFLSSADRMYLTYIDAQFEGDEYFPCFDPARWRESHSEIFAAGDDSTYAYTFVTLDRCTQVADETGFES